MQSYLLGQYEKSMPHSMSLREKLLLSRKCGFDYLEISVDETDEKLSRLDWGKEERHALRRAVEEAGQPVLSMCLSAHRKYPLGSSNPETAAQSLAISEKAVQFARKLESGKFNLPDMMCIMRRLPKKQGSGLQKTCARRSAMRKSMAFYWGSKPWRPPL